MKRKSPYSIIKHRYVTEKARVLEELQSSDTNACTRKCTNPKYVFKVSMDANKIEIKKAFETIYPNVQVTSVNTITIPRKKRRVRGRLGMKSAYKKAIVTLAEGNQIDEQV